MINLSYRFDQDSSSLEIAGIPDVSNGVVATDFMTNKFDLRQLGFGAWLAWMEAKHPGWPGCSGSAKMISSWQSATSWPSRMCWLQTSVICP